MQRLFNRGVAPQQVFPCRKGDRWFAYLPRRGNSGRPLLDRTYAFRSGAGSARPQGPPGPASLGGEPFLHAIRRRPPAAPWACVRNCADRKGVVLGKSVSVRVDLGGRSCIKIKKQIESSN